MRRLVYWAMGMAVACGLWVYGGLSAHFLPLAIAAVAVAILLTLLRKHRLAAVLVGLVLGLTLCAAHNSLVWQHAQALDGVTATATIRLSDFGEDTAYGVAADGRMEVAGRQLRVRVYLDGDITPQPGLLVTGTFYFRSTAPGSSTYYASRGTMLLAYSRDTPTVRQDKLSLLDFPASMRQRIRDILGSLFPADTLGFAKALLLGDTTDLDYETDIHLKRSGIRHILAVSGLHVSIFFGALEVLTLRKRYLTALVGFPGLLLFAAVMGFSPSVSRACVMVALMLLARLLDKEYDGPSALAFAVVVILGLNPAAIASVAFQLSVASVAGIFCFQPGIHGWLHAKFRKHPPKSIQARLIRWFCSSVSVSLGATAFTVPLCAWYFGTVSLVAVVTNLLTLWMVSLLFYGLCIICLLPWKWIAWVLSWGIRYVLLVAEVLDAFPLAAVYTASPYIVAWLVFVYVLLGLFLLMKNRKPWMLVCCATLGLCMSLMASWLEVDLDDVRITVLDVGQGQSILLQTEGRSFLVDCGGDSDTGSAELAAHTLLSQGMTHLDGLILTHCDRDHAGGAGYLPAWLDVDLVIQPANGSVSLDAPTVYASADLELTIGTGVLRIFAPRFPGADNESSLCVLLDTEKCDILITGDRSGFGERSLLRNSDIGKVDVLIAGHHGSKNSTCQELLEAVRPDIVCISAGADNPYGHPAGETLARLAEFGCRVYRTDLQGTITIRR